MDSFGMVNKKQTAIFNKRYQAKSVYTYKRKCKRKNIYIDFVNGYTDHIHCLISLHQEQTIAKVVQLIKGESSFWINKNNLCNQKFEWQGEYFAVSVSESSIHRVREYIKNQETHHATKTFQQEYDEFMEKYGFELIKDSSG